MNLKARAAFLVTISCAIFLAACMRSSFQPMSSLSLTTTSQGQTIEPQSVTLATSNFDVVYTGGGAVNFQTDGVEYYPETATTPSETHASLLLLQPTETTPLKDFELIVDVETEAQLRQNSAPNVWEVFWFFFGYVQTSDGNKTTNYYISKPVGSELGLAQGLLGQTFLDTSTAFPTAVATRHVFTFKRVGAAFTVLRDGQLVYSYQDSSSALYQNKGAIGFYSEDARVKIYSLKYVSLDTL